MRRKRVYCPSHQSVFETEGGRQIFCEIGNHEISTAFPIEGFWNFCCDCETFFPTRYTAGEQAGSSCPICERDTKLRYLCDGCGTISYDSSEQSRGKRYSIPSATSSVLPNCPGCSKTVKGEFAPHVCQTILAAYQSPRSTCPFCELAIESTIGGQAQNANPIEVDLNPNTPSNQGIICAECQFLNSNESSFCVNCGADISWDMTETVFGGPSTFDFNQPTSSSTTSQTEQSHLRRLPSQKKSSSKAFVIGAVTVAVIFVSVLIGFQFLSGDDSGGSDSLGKGMALEIQPGQSKTFMGTIDGRQMQMVIRNVESRLVGEVTFQDESGQKEDGLEGTFTKFGFEAQSSKKGTTYKSGFYKARQDSTGRLIGYWESNFGMRRYFEAYQPTGL